MAYTKKSGEVKIVSQSIKRELVADVQKLPILEIKGRGIRKEIAELFGVRTALSEKDGKTPIAHYFPRYNSNDEVTGYMKRDLTRDKGDDYHFTFIGSCGASTKFFGQDVAEKLDRRKTSLICVEGEWDVLSAYQACYDANKGGKYDGLVPFVVGLNSGTVNAVESFYHNKGFVEKFDEVCLAFDNDKASPKERERGFVRGYECRQNVAAAMMGSNITTIEWGKFKDASDYLQGGFVKELAKLVQFDRISYTPDKLLLAADIDIDEILKPREKGVMSEIFPELDAKMQGFRLRELTVLCAPSSVGKSSVSAALAYQFMASGHKLGCIFLEEQSKDTIQRLAARHLHVNFNNFREDPLKCGKSEVEVRAAFEYIKGTDLTILDHFGSMALDDLMAKIKHMVFVQGIKYIILDHLSLLISGMKTTDERKELDLTMTELASFCAANDVHILAVSHINRSGAADFKAPKELKEGESFWVQVTKESMRGSSSLEQLAWNVLGLEPEINWDRSRGKVRLVVLKNREHATLGVADTFSMDDTTGDFVLYKAGSELL